MTPAPAPHRPHAPGVRASLALLVLACIVPVAMAAACLIVDFYHKERTQLIDSAVARARAIGAATERDIESAQLALQTLSSSTLLRDQDLRAFHPHAAALAGRLGADSIVLLDTDGTLLLSTRRPYGAPLARLGRAPLLQRILASGRPGVSDMFIGPLNGKPIFSVGVPVLRDGAVVMTLNAIYTPDRLLHVLSEQKLPDSWRASVLDTEGRVVTRSHELAAYAGRQAGAALRQQLAGASESGLATRALDGRDAYVVYSRSPRTGWTAMLAIPGAELTARQYGTLAWLVSASAAALAAGLGLAWLLGGRIARSGQALVEPARAVGAVASLAQPAPGLAEVDQILAGIVAEDQRAGAIIERQRLDVHELVHSVMRLARNELIQRGLTVRAELDAEPLAIRGDPLQLRQVLIQLLMNACDARPAPPDSDGVIVLRCARAGDAVLFSVIDGGASFHLRLPLAAPQ